MGERGFSVGPYLFDHPSRIVTCHKCDSWFGWTFGEPAQCPRCGRRFTHLVKAAPPQPECCATSFTTSHPPTTTERGE